MIKNSIHKNYLYNEPIDLPFELPTHMYGGMIALWMLRKDLQKRFPLQKNKYSDYLNFLSWCCYIGRRESVLLAQIESWNTELNRPAELPLLQNDPWQGIYNVAMLLSGIYRSKYLFTQLISNTEQRHKVARWYFREGRHQIAMPAPQAWQINALRNKFSNFDVFLDKLLITKDTKAEQNNTLQFNADLKHDWNKDDLPVAERISAYKVNLGTSKIYETLPTFVNLASPANLIKKRVLPTTAEMTRLSHLFKNPSKKILPKQCNYPFGVNLYGYARGELGIGEDVRMLALSLEKAGVPFCVINIQLGENVSQKDSSIEHWIVTEPLYQINVFCMTGIEMSRYILSLGTSVLHHRYNIGLWPWELPQWPTPWEHCWDLVDEIWGISSYTASAYANAPVPVTKIDLPVVVDKVANFDRSYWKLPSDAYLFVFAFDMNSKLTRKNPLAVIKAFKQAFPRKNKDNVGLVLKISHVNKYNIEWIWLKNVIAKDPRIILIEEEFRRAEILSLYQNCDCYLSLHRSEGFGRGIAEAQLLGLSVIVTGYSGNMDFCSSPPTHCVNYSIKPLKANEYFYGDGQHWAEPDLDHAAGLMKHCFENTRKPISYDTSQFSLDHCGHLFKAQLTRIYTTLHDTKGTLNEAS